MVIDGRRIASEILNELKVRVQKLKEKGLPAGRQGITPHLAIVLVGENPQSKSYVEQKELKGNKIGAKISVHRLTSIISESELLKTIEQLNNDSNVHGIIVQRPLPSQIVNSKINRAIDPKKDVDAFNPDSPYNPPVAEAVLKLLEHVLVSNNKVNHNLTAWLNSQSIVILGKGETGGSPIIRTFEKMGVNYSLVDSRTPNPELKTASADIIISAVGKPYTVTPQNIKRGAILISVGLSKGSDGKLRGDYAGREIKDIASFYTPTPGGVGPVNVAFLLSNLVKASEEI